MIATARRLGLAMRRIAARLDDSLVGDAIGCVCLFLTIYLLSFFAGILS